MKTQRISATIAGALLAVASVTHAQRPARTTGSLDSRVEALLRQMTLEEKIGQMTQLTIQAVSKTRGTATVAHELDSLKLDSAIVHYHVGSLLNVYDVAFTPQHWQDVINTVQRVAARGRLKIPVIYGIDAVHGHHYMTGTTLFPQNIALAATWNPDLVRKANQITAYETRASGIHWNFSPVLDLGRAPLWSRFFETFGEDTYLASTLGVAAVEGQQQDPRPAMASLLGAAAPSRATASHDVFVAATGKHYLGYSMPLSGKDRTTAWIPDRQLREYFVPTFRAAIDAGMRTVMVNSGDINGVPVHASHELLTVLLRRDLGFKGVAVSDWEDINRLATVHRVAANRKDAVRMAVMAGIDMSMVPYNLSFYHDLLALAKERTVPLSRIDEAVRRILKLKLELGMFESSAPDPAMLANVGAPGFRAVSRTAADEAITLLKNEGAVLPLAKSSRILVTGPGATSLPSMHGSWTYTWQGTDTAMYPRDVKTPLDAIRAIAGGSNVTFVPGTSLEEETDIPAAVAAARNSDVAIVILAEPASTEQPGIINDLGFNAAQLRLARAIEATGKPVVLAIFEGRPRIIRPVVDSARAVVMGYQTGPYGGEALARVLFGDVNPSGKLPFTYSKYAGSIEFYDYTGQVAATGDQREGGFKPEWQFGHGLSYTTFAYSDLKLGRAQVGRRDTVTVSVNVANTGKREGKEVVQLYVRDLVASITPPNRRLRGYQKIALAPGERKTVSFRLAVSDLAFIGHDDKPVVEPGDFDVMIGSQTVRLTVR